MESLNEKERRRRFEELKKLRRVLFSLSGSLTRAVGRQQAEGFGRARTVEGPGAAGAKETGDLAAEIALRVPAGNQV